MTNTNSQVIDQAIIFPDSDLKDRFDALIGIDDQKEKLYKILDLLVNPNSLTAWANQYHPKSHKILQNILRRPPLIVLEGDVGSGKTELATTIGDLLARNNKIEVTLLPLSLSARGQGRVGEMTKLISTAFEQTVSEGKKLKSENGKIKGAVILLVDEADAITQSRESNQMHHEDKAGVNAFIRGIDHIANSKIPAAVIMCTNRLNSLDPAVKRRAAEILSFHRPNKEQRKSVIGPLLSELEIDQHSIDEIVTLTGSNKERGYGFTFSDLIQRLVPTIILDAYPDQAVSAIGAVKIASELIPTPPFKDN